MEPETTTPEPEQAAPESITPEIEEAAPDEPSAATSAATPPANRSRTLILALAVLSALTTAAAVTFGILWGAANTDLRAVQSDLLAAERAASKLETKVSTLEDKYSDAEAERVNMMLAYLELERDAKYTACVSYFGGYTQASGLTAALAVSVAMGSCAEESDWTFAIKAAP